MTPAATAAKRALSVHDMDHAEADVYERIAECVTSRPAEPVEAVATQLDREQLGLEQAPETQAAARAVVAAVNAVAT